MTAPLLYLPFRVALPFRGRFFARPAPRFRLPSHFPPPIPPRPHFFPPPRKFFFQFLKKNIYKKKFAIPKCYTILESWEQMPQHGFDKNLIRRIFFFNIQRGDPLDFQKRFLQCRGVIFQKKKFCVFGSLSNMSKNGLRMVVCLNFDITHLSPPSIYRAFGTSSTEINFSWKTRSRDQHGSILVQDHFHEWGGRQTPASIKTISETYLWWGLCRDWRSEITTWG